LTAASFALVGRAINCAAVAAVVVVIAAAAPGSSTYVAAAIAAAAAPATAALRELGVLFFNPRGHVVHVAAYRERRRHVE
jgi:hypothetical protein